LAIFWCLKLEERTGAREREKRRKGEKKRKGKKEEKRGDDSFPHSQPK
jgi:hypothetical protein